MHILKIIHGYPPNYNAGSEVYSQSICKELSKRNNVTVFTREENPYSPDFEIRHDFINENLSIYYANNPNGKDGYRHSQLDEAFAQLLFTLKPDIAHIGHLNHLSTGIIDELNKQQIPVIFTLHDFWLMCPRGQFLTRSIGMPNNFKLCNQQSDLKCAIDCYQVYFGGRESNREEDCQSWKQWVHNRMDETRAIVDKVDLFIAPSNYLRTRFINDFSIPESKIIYLDYGFPTEYLRKTAKDKSIFTFGYIGTHIPAKGVNLLIEAFSQISEPAELIIYGRCSGQSSEALKQLATKSKNKIIFAGEYANQDIADYVFSNIDCIVVPSIWTENSPLVIHEAQACKIPVITADTGGMKEYVQHNINGLLFEHRNTNSLKEQLLFAIKNPTIIKEYGKKGYLYSNNGDVPNIKDHCIELEQIYLQHAGKKKLWRITIDTNPEDCNLNCIMCEEHSKFSSFTKNLQNSTGIKRRVMSLDMVEDIFKQASLHNIQEIIPSTMGEPLLYKNIDRIFELSQKHNIKINLTTNGTFPKKSASEWAQLIVPNTTDIKISLNGATKETSESIMIGSDFDKTISNIKDFVEYRDNHFKITGYYCSVTLQVTFMQNNMDELNDIIKLAAQLGADRVKGHHLWTHFNEIESLSMKASNDSIMQWNDYVDQAYKTQDNYRKLNGKRVKLDNITAIENTSANSIPQSYECPFLLQELWISPTGEISPCCAPDQLRKSLGYFGSIETTSISEVMKSTVYQDLATNYKSKSLCQTCNMRKPL